MSACCNNTRTIEIGRVQPGNSDMLDTSNMVNVFEGTQIMEGRSQGSNSTAVTGIDLSETEVELQEGELAGGNQVVGRAFTSTPNIIPNAPTFRVPANPLLPRQYQEILNYNDIQYANGFFRTQIGRFVRVESYFGTEALETYYGYLIGVGLNYILLQESAQGNIFTVDFWTIKSVYFYYGGDQNMVSAEEILNFELTDETM